MKLLILTVRLYFPYLGAAMMRPGSLFVFVLAMLAVPVAVAARDCGKSTTILIVRHAERPAGVDTLDATGFARAEDLARACRSVGIGAIYHSNTVRTRLTAAPAARLLAITPIEYPATDFDALIGDIFTKHCGGTVLVVGHSNTVGRIIAAAGGPSMPDLADDEFDNLFVLRLRGDSADLLHLHYGSRAP